MEFVDITRAEKLIHIAKREIPRLLFSKIIPICMPRDLIANTGPLLFLSLFSVVRENNDML